MKVINKDLINEFIPNIELLIIDENGNKLGLFQKQGALSLARNKGLDLVLISPDAKPAVAKLMDYSKFRFEQQKKLKEHKKNQRVAIVNIKEVQLSPTIAVHDMETKANNAKKFIANGDKVKVAMRLRGRMMAHKDLGIKVMSDFLELMSEVSVLDGKMKSEENYLLMFLVPIKK